MASKFLDHLDSFTGPRDTVVFRTPLNAVVDWDVSSQHSYQSGKKYRIGVNFGAQVVVPGNVELGLIRRDMRRLMAREIYGQLDGVKDDLLGLAMELNNVPDENAHRMASKLRHILINLKEATE